MDNSLARLEPEARQPPLRFVLPLEREQVFEQLLGDPSVAAAQLRTWARAHPSVPRVPWNVMEEALRRDFGGVRFLGFVLRAFATAVPPTDALSSTGPGGRRSRGSLGGLR